MGREEYNVVDEIKKSLPNIGSDDGEILWGLVVNRDVKLPSGQIVSGSFRWWGARIAEAVGEGDYLDYYMSSTFRKMILEAIEPGLYDRLESEMKSDLESKGWEFIEDIVICDRCGKPIERFAPKLFSIKTGETLCTDCGLDEDKEI